MKWQLDLHPFARGGSVAIVAISLMHITQATLWMLFPAASNATCMMALLITFRAIHEARILPTIMIVTAVLALVGAVSRIGWLRLVIFLPQHFMLGVMAVGGLGAAVLGMYLDGTVKQWSHILSDQLPLVALFAIHTSAIIRRARDPNG